MNNDDQNRSDRGSVPSLVLNCSETIPAGVLAANATYVAAIDAYCQKTTKGAKEPISFKLEDYCLDVYYDETTNEAHLDYCHKRFVTSIKALSMMVAAATAQGVDNISFANLESLYGQAGQIGFWQRKQQPLKENEYHFDLVWPKKPRKGLNTGLIVDYCKDVLRYLVSIKFITSINPFNRFSKERVRMVGQNVKVLDEIKSTCVDRWPDARQAIETMSTLTEPANWEVVYENKIYEAFTVYGLKKSAKSDTFDPSNLPAAAATLANDVKARGKRVAGGATSESRDSKIEPVTKRIRRATKDVMGPTADVYASALLSKGSLSNRYEWCHRIGHSLKPSGADVPENLFLGTSQCNTWMLVYEMMAKQLMNAGKKVHVAHKNLNINQWGNVAPDLVEYTVNYGNDVVVDTKLDAREARQPSCWINAIVRTCIDKMPTATSINTGVSRGVWSSAGSYGELFAGEAVLAFEAAPARRDTQAPDPFNHGTAPTTLRCPKEIQVILAGGAGVGAQTLADFLGLPQITDLRAMSRREQDLFYKTVISIDPDAAAFFPSPDQGVNPDEQTLIGNTTYLDQRMVLMTYVKLLPDNTLAHLTGLYPTKSVFDLLPVVTNARFILFEGPPDTKPDTAPSSQGSLRFAATVNLSEAFQFIPGFPGGLSLDLASTLSNQTEFTPFSAQAPLNLQGVLPSGTVIDVNEHCHLEHLSVGVSVVKRLDMSTGATTWMVAKSFTASLRLDINESESLTLGAIGEEFDGHAALVATVQEWKNPFGIHGFTLDQVELSLTLNPFSVAVSAGISVDFPNADSIQIDLAGSWSKEAGPALLGVLEGPLKIEHLIALHKRVTRGDQGLVDNHDAAGVTLDQIVISFCKSETTIGDVKCPAGLALQARLTLDGAAETVAVTIVISPEDGITFTGDLKHLSLGPVTVSDAELDFEICPKYPAKNYLQVTSTLQLFNRLNVDLLLRLGAVKCAYAHTDKLDLHFSDLVPALSFLDFDFHDVIFSYASAATHVMLPNSVGVLEDVALPEGEVLAGAVQFHLLDKILGRPLPFTFAYHTSDRSLDFTLGGSPSQALAGRLSAPTGLFLEVRDATFVCGFGTSFTIFNHPVTLDAGVAFGGPSGDDAMTMNLFAQYRGDLSLPLPLATSPLVIQALALDADISPGGSFGSLTAGGKFGFGKTHAVLDFTLAADQEGDALRAQITEATLEDIFTFGLNILGIKVPAIPLLDDILIHKLVIYFAPNGMTLGTKKYPAGFSFDADLEVFGERVDALIAMTGATFTIEASIAPFKLGNVISVRAVNGKDPHFKLDASPTSAEINIDCAVHFLIIDVQTVINIKTPSTFHFDFDYSLLGVDLRIQADKVGSDDFKLALAFGATQRAAAQKGVIDQVMLAAKKMQQEANSVKEEGEAAEAAYEKGLNQLQAELDAAQKAFDEYLNSISSSFGDEQNDLNHLLGDAGSDIDKLSNDLEKNKEKAVQDFYDLEKELQKNLDALKRDIATLNGEVTSVTKDFNARMDAARTHFDEQIGKAQEHLNNASDAVDQAQQNLDIIEGQKPHGRGCSDSDVEQWQQQVNQCQHDLEQAKSDLANAKTYLQQQKEQKDKEITAIQSEMDDKLQHLKDNLKAQQDALDSLQGDVDALGHLPDISQLADLDHQKLLAENTYERQIKILQQKQRADTSPTRLSFTKSTRETQDAALNVARLQQLQSEYANGSLGPDAEQLIAKKKEEIRDEAAKLMAAIGAFHSDMESKIQRVQQVVAHVEPYLTPEIDMGVDLGQAVIDAIDKLDYDSVIHDDDVDGMDQQTNRILVVYSTLLKSKNGTPAFAALLPGLRSVVSSILHGSVPGLTTNTSDITSAIGHLDDDLQRSLDIFTERDQEIDKLFGYINDINQDIQAYRATARAATSYDAQEWLWDDYKRDMAHDPGAIASWMSRHHAEVTPSARAALQAIIDFGRAVSTNFYNDAVHWPDARGHCLEGLCKSLRDNSDDTQLPPDVTDIGSGDYDVMSRSLTAIIGHIHYIQSLIVHAKPIFKPQSLKDAVDVASQSSTTNDGNRSQRAQEDRALQEQIDQLTSQYQADIARIDAAIKKIEDGLPDLKTLARLKLELERAGEALRNQINDGQKQVGDLRHSIDDATKHGQDLQHQEQAASSPAGKRLAQAKADRDEWQNGPLAKAAAAAAAAMNDAAAHAEVAAEIMKKVASGSALSFAEISASAVWSADDIVFHFDVNLDFHLHVDIHVGPVHIAFNIDISGFHFQIDIDLRQIEQLVAHVFAYLWKQISSKL